MKDRHLCDGVQILEHQIFSDNRGYFYERFNEKLLFSKGVHFKIVQDNIVFTKHKGTVRGMGYQLDPNSQAKIITCIKGSIKDICVDLRKGSPNYLKSTVIDLSEDKQRSIYIPRGFAHGYMTTADDAIVQFYVDNDYNADSDRVFRFDDPIVGVLWDNVDESLMSIRDRNAPLFEECECNYVYGEEAT